MSEPDPPYVIDLHAHFPMQLDPESQGLRRQLRKPRDAAGQPRRHEKLCDRARFFVLQVADYFFNRDHVGGEHAVTLDSLAAGNVGVALSVAYLPFAEIDVDRPPGSPPEDGYFTRLLGLLQVVDEVVQADARAALVKTPEQLEQALAAGQNALIHAVEGGFHLGESDAAIRAHVAELAAFGTGYVTVAHLFWRRLATNAAALPFLSDKWYHRLFPQPDVGLEARGRLMIRELVRHGILVDLTHMSERSMRDAFALLDEIDPDKSVPPIATHIACSFGKYEYNLKRSWVERIAERGGVCGVLYCDHYLRHGRGRRTGSFEQSCALIREQIDRLIEWGGESLPAIGSDLDGFIKPALEGLSSAADHRRLAAWLVGEYGVSLADKITHGNALRVLREAWMCPRDDLVSADES